MIKKLKSNVKKALAVSVVLSQVATCGIIAPQMASAANTTDTARMMENLSRGTVAMKTDDGVYISWRRLATEPADTQFTLYRNKEKVAEGAITNFVDEGGTVNDRYTVVKNGETMSESVSVWENNYIDIPLAETPESNVMLSDRNGYYYGSYTPGDSSFGDVDGDGEYEIIMMWNPSNAKDAATTGQTDKVFIDCYEMDGTQLWRIDMGYNIRAGAHDTQLMVADFNLDGKAELIVRTADGTTDAAGNVVGDAARGETYEASWAAMNSGKNLQGPLYLTAFNGETGEIIDTTDYYLNNVQGSNSVSLTFGDDFGNRSERYNGTIAYLDGVKPAVVVGRGYYGGKPEIAPGRTAIATYSLENNQLEMIWKWDTNDSGNDVYIGQGNHQIEAGDVDNDGKDEIFLGAITWDDDGSILWCTGYGHGDAMHLGDFDPTNEGLEFMKVHEEGEHAYNTELGGDTAIGATTAQIWGMVVQDAETGQILQTHNGIKDTGRGMIGNIGYGDSYYVAWGAGSTGYWDNEGNNLGDLGLAMNGRIYWDGDLQDELQDHVQITKWNDDTKSVDTLLDGASQGALSINGSKGNVNLQGDFIGDWREELVAYTILDSTTSESTITIQGDPADPLVDNRTPTEIEVTVKKTDYQYGLRLYTTNIPTEYNFYTLMHDDIYRNSSSAYNNCYNQPPHISWYMNDKIEGSTYTTQPETNIQLVSNSYTEAAFDEALLPEGGSSTTDPDTEGTPFTDIAGHWGESFITEMYQKGVINGMTETTFEPETTITKGEFIKLISASLGLEMEEAVEGEHWAVPFVDAAVAAGLVNEAITLDNLDEQITREQMASIVAKAAAYAGVDTTGGSVENFTDADTISDWAVEDVAAAVQTGIVQGNEDGTFAPLQTATRAEAATMMSRLLALVEA